MTPRGGYRKSNPGGRPALPPEQKARPINLKIPPALLAQIDAAAEAAGLNRTQWLILAARAYLTR